MTPTPNALERCKAVIMNKDLEPCPWCGEQPVVTDDADGHYELMCSCPLSGNSASTSCAGIDRKHAEERWNQIADAVARRRFIVHINGKHFYVEARELCYSGVIRLAGFNAKLVYTVTYRRGAASKPDGILMPGQSVRIVDGMAFSVAHTGDA